MELTDHIQRQMSAEGLLARQIEAARKDHLKARLHGKDLEDRQGSGYNGELLKGIAQQMSQLAGG